MVAARLALLGAVALLSGAEGLRAISRISHKAAARGGLDEVVIVLGTMMSDFRSQTTADESAWTNYQTWAQNTEVERTEYIRQQDALVLSNTALMNAKQQDVQRLTGEISQLMSSIAETQNSLQELVTMRHQEHTQHETALTDLTKTIDAVGRAIQILEGHYAATGAALTEITQQVQFALTLTGKVNQKSPLTSLMQRTPDWLSVDGAKYSTYEKQGGAGGVMGTLNELRSALDASKQSAIETEATAERDFLSQKEMQEGTITRLQGEKTQKTTEKGEAKSAITMAQATIAQASENKKDAQTTLTLLAKDVETFTNEYQARQRTRTSEMQATQAALDALQSVSAGAKEGVAASSLMQLATSKFSKCARCQREENKLRSLSKALQSSSLTQVAGELAQRAHSSQGLDPNSMDPVKDLLSKLITRLETEASAETSHHDWCETEKSQSVSAQTQREDTVKSLQGEIERFTLSVQQLKGEVEFLVSEIERVHRENDEATSNRNAAHEGFVKAEADHTEVIGAVNQALQALGGQYGLLQVKRRQQSSPFESYSSGAGGASSATAMLEDLLQRYESALTQLRTDEQSAKTAYDALMFANKQFLTDSEATKNAKIAERRGKVQQLANQKHELKTNFVELKELSQYLQDLRPSCDDIRSTFEERKKRRQAEIDALKECLAVLSDPSALQ